MNEWKKVKLKEVLKEVNERNKDEKVKKVLSVTNSKGFVNQEEYFEGTVHSANISNYKIVRRNQFAYNPSRINVGSIDILKDYEYGALSPMYVVFEVDTTKLMPEYFKYYFQTNRFLENVKNNTQGSVRNSLSFKALSDFDYLLPSIEEQEKIVLILNTIDSILDKLSRLEQQVNMEKERLVKDIYIKKDKYMKIGDIADVTKLAGFEFTEYFKYIDDGEIIALRALNLKNGKIDLTDIKKIKKEVSENLLRSKLYKDDILFSYVGTVGEVAIIEEDDKFHLAPNVAKITVKNKELIKPKYLCYYLQNSISKKEMYKYTTITSQPAISMENIRNIKINVIAEDKQKESIRINELFNEKLGIVKRLSNEYMNLKKALMQKLLTGKVRVKL